MKRFLSFLSFVLFFCPVLALAQFTTVSGTVTDPNGLPYAFGTIASVIVSSNTPKFTSTGNPYFQPTQATGLDATGHFVVTLADNTALTPGGSTWTFTVCSAGGTEQPAFGKGPVCFVVSGVTISGSSQNITSTLNAAAKALTFTFTSTTGALLVCSDSSGSGTAQVCTTSPSFTPAAGSCVAYLTTTTNTGALTVNVNASGADPVQKWLGTALASGDVPANRPIVMCFDGTNWNVSTIGNAPAGTGTVTGTGTAGDAACWLSASALGNCFLTQSGSGVTAQTQVPTNILASITGSTSSTATPTANVIQAQNFTSVSCAASSSILPSIGLGINASQGCTDVFFQFEGRQATPGTTDVNAAGMFYNSQASNNNNQHVGIQIGGYGLVDDTNNTIVGTAIGLFGRAEAANMAITSQNIGVYAFADAANASATPENDGLYAVTGTSGSGSSTIDDTIHVASPIGGSGMSAHNGIQIDDQTVGIAGGISINEVGNGPNLFQGHIGQQATGNWAGHCTMAAATTCTFTISAAYTSTPICGAFVQSAAPTTFQGSCALSGITVTITASAANSNKWGAVLTGDPN